MDFPALRYFRESDAITRTANHLPHWEQEGACYFLTFHLADSLPDAVLKQWKSECDAWLALYPPPWTHAQELAYHQRFSAQQEAWLDAGHGSCCLRHPEIATIAGDALHFHDGGLCVMHAFVVMPNHIHALCTLRADARLAHLVQSWKRYSARLINQRLGQKGTLWQKDYFDRMIRNYDHFMNVVRYIRHNPEKGHAPRAPLYLAPWL